MTGKRITIVTAQLRGYDRVGGAGTATTFLSLALARQGHDVNVLYIGPTQTRTPEGEWARLYADAGVTLRRAPVFERKVQPLRHARMRAVERVLRAEPPDVVIGHDFGAPVYHALRLRQLGLEFEHVLFVTLCHGTRRWVKEVNRNARVSADVLAENLLERAGVELSDVVVSPSAFMLDWMRGQGWRLPESRVIPYFTRSTASGEAGSRCATEEGDVERIAFFGRLQDIKGVQPFLAGLNAVPPRLLAGRALEFVGRPTKEWSPDRIEASLSQAAREALTAVSFATDLDQHEALGRLSRPGTLAVMPSIADNSPNAVYECLERGIPFIASSAGGIGELVAPDERARVLFEPTADGISAALTRALQSRDALRPARPAFDETALMSGWADVLTLEPKRPPRVAETANIDAVAVHRASDDRPADASWILVLDDSDVPDSRLVETLLRAQAASGADVVTCGVLSGETEYFFAGEPGGLGVLANEYGTAALVRRDLLDAVADPWRARDPAWPLLARLSAAGARVVSVPLPLVERADPPGTLAREPSDALLVVEHVERSLPGPLRSLARLAAGLAADAARATDAS